MKIMPDFDQTILDFAVLKGMTLERLAVIGVIPPSAIDTYEMMLAHQDVVTIETIVEDDGLDIVAATMLIYKKGPKQWDNYV